MVLRSATLAIGATRIGARVAIKRLGLGLFSLACLCLREEPPTDGVAFCVWVESAATLHTAGFMWWAVPSNGGRVVWRRGQEGEDDVGMQAEHRFAEWCWLILPVGTEGLAEFIDKGLESRQLESRPKAAARLSLGESAGWSELILIFTT